MFGPFDDPMIPMELGGAFGRTSAQIREKRQRSVEREAVGNKARVETSDTDDLVDILESELKNAITTLHSSEALAGLDVSIETSSTTYQQGEENAHGADIGLRLHISSPEFNITKAALFQNKRMYVNGSSYSFDALQGDGEVQAEKMLSITPASFFLLFSSLSNEQVAPWIMPPGSCWPPIDLWSVWQGFGQYVLPEVTAWDTGVMVLPASRVYAEARVLPSKGRRLNTDAQHWMRAAIPFGAFMTDMFGSCFVGDVRDDLVRLVTPPRLRDLSNTGADTLLPSHVPVKKLISIAIAQTRKS